MRGPVVVDSHIHLYHESVYKDAKSWAISRNEPYWLSCVKPERGRSLQAWKNPDQLLRHMDAAFVDKVVILAWYWENHDTCLENFAWQKNWVREHPDRFRAFAPFNALGRSDALKLLEEAFDIGFLGIGELNPPAQGYAYDSDYLAAALELTSQYGLSVNFHVTDPATHDYPGKIETPFDELLSLAGRYPKTNFILAHLGGLEPIRTDHPLPQNLYYDTAAYPLLYKNCQVYQDFCNKVSTEKILFGTDYPLRVFPKNAQSPDFETALEHLHDCGLKSEDLELITYKNARKLFKLS